MGYCKDCKFWKQHTEPIPLNRRVLIHTGHCSNENLQYLTPMKPEEEKAGRLYYEDSEEYRAELMTDAEFGCIHFEAK